MSIRLIAFDLDGTLLDDRKEISGENRAALYEAAAKGIHLVPCTARLFGRMPLAVREMPFIRYAVTVNGAEVYDRETDRALFRAEIPAEEADRLYAYMDGLPAVYDCYQEGEAYMDREMLERAPEMFSDAYTLSLIRSRRPVAHFRRTMLERGLPIQKTQMFFADGELGRREEEFGRIKEIFPLYTVTGSLYNNLEINAGEANKGDALMKLCGYLGIEPSECLAVGDGNNDISMLRQAGTGVAMANAPGAVRQAADWVTGNNGESGVAGAIRHFAL